jgi:hypothetical protein
MCGFGDAGAIGPAELWPGIVGGVGEERDGEEERGGADECLHAGVVWRESEFAQVKEW